MTISSTSNTTVAQGNGITTSFDFPFPVPQASELLVYFTDATGSVTLVSPTLYGTTGIGTANGGSVTYPLVGSPIASGTSLTIQRVVPYVQLTDLVNQSGYYPNVVENALDYLTMQTQQLAEQAALSLNVPIAATPPNLTYPPVAARAGTLAGFDALGNAATYPLTSVVGSGDLTIEGPFLAGTNFTPGVSNSVTLSKAYGTKANLGTVVMAGIAQSPDTYTLVGEALTFNAVIPVGVDKIWCIGGSTIPANIPANGSVGPLQMQPNSVGDGQLAWGPTLGRVCDSIGALEALSISVYVRAFVTGYYAANDGGGGAYVYSASTPAANANGGTIIGAAGGVGCWLRAGDNSRISAKVFGAKGDGATDDTASIQNALNYIGSIGGGEVSLPPGIFNNTGLTITTFNTKLVGSGGDTAHDGGAGSGSSTLLRFTGAAGGAVLYCYTPNTATSSIVTGIEVRHLGIDGNNLAGYGLLTISIRSFRYENLFVTGVSVSAYQFSTVPRAGASEATDTQLGLVIHCTWRLLATFSLSANGMVLGAAGNNGTAGANTSFNTFINCDGESGNAAAWLLLDCDNNTLIGCTMARTNLSFPGLEIEGGDNNYFYGFSAGGSLGIRIRGTADGFFHTPVANGFYSLDTGNGTSYPTLGAGCQVNGLMFENPVLATTATGGGVQATPTTVLGYFTVKIGNGTVVKVPYFAP